MKRKLFVGIVTLCLALIVGVTGALADGGVNLTLKEAIRRGLESSVAMQQAQLRVQLLDLEYKQAEVNARATVTPLQLEQAKQAHENAVYEADLQRVQTALSVESAYYSVLKAQFTVDLRTSALDRAAQQVEIAQMRHGMGQITDVHLAEAEQRLMESELALRQATNTLHLAKLQLNHLIGATGEEFTLTDDVVFAREEIDVETSLSGAQERRFEIRRAKQQVANAEQAVRLADNTYTPRIDLERAQIALSQALLSLDQAVEQVRSDVWQAIIRLEEASIRSELAESRLDLASASLSLAELRYQNGLNTLLDVLLAEAELAEAEVEAVAAAYDYNVAMAQYLSSIGLGFERWPDLLDSMSEGAE